MPRNQIKKKYPKNWFTGNPIYPSSKRSSLPTHNKGVTHEPGSLHRLADRLHKSQMSKQRAKQDEAAGRITRKKKGKK